MSAVEAAAQAVPGSVCPSCMTPIRRGADSCPSCRALIFEDGGEVGSRRERLRGYGPGALLLREPEALFQRVYAEEDLGGLGRYLLHRGLVQCFLYGLCMGVHAGGLQIVASGLKVVLLGYGTLLVCLPSLYTFNLLLGSKMRLAQTLCVLLLGSYMMSVVLLSFAPVVLLFVAVTRSHHFLSLLNMIVFAGAGALALRLTWRALRFMVVKSGHAFGPGTVRAWCVLYMVVGTQLARVLRPFIGDPGAFAWTRPIQGNFYLNALNVISVLIRGL